MKSIAALDPTGNADAMRSRLRSSPIDHGNPCDRSSGDRNAVVPGRRRASAGRQYHGTTERSHLPNLTERHVTPIGVGSRATPHSADVDANQGAAAADGEGAKLAGGRVVDGPRPSVIANDS